jgi:hypothetical protein
MGAREKYTHSVAIFFAIGPLIIIGLWALVAIGKLIQTLSRINLTLQEIKLVLRDGRNHPDT